MYDDAKSSYKNAIEKYFPNEFEVHCVGINDLKFHNYHRIDLSLLNFNLFDELNKLPKPDIILASPPCESWSGADCDGRMFRSIDENGNWRVMNKKYYEKYIKNCHPVKRRYFFQKEIGRLLGESTIGATISIINYFKPRAWVIENPRTSRTWEFQENHWNFKANNNLTCYSSYSNDFSLKPTILKSNLKLDLKKNKSIGNKKHMSHGSYAKRSSIPHELIRDMMLLISKQIGANNA